MTYHIVPSILSSRITTLKTRISHMGACHLKSACAIDCLTHLLSPISFSSLLYEPLSPVYDSYLR